MTDWIQRLDAFLQFNENQIFMNPGSVSHEVARTLGEGGYDNFRVVRERETVIDIEQEVNRLEAGRRRPTSEHALTAPEDHSTL